MWKVFIISIVLAQVCLMQNVSDSDEDANSADQDEPKNRLLNSIYQDMRIGIARFSGKFFYELMKLNPESSLIMSPGAVLFLLAQLALFSVDTAQSQLLASMNLQNQDQIRQIFPIIVEDLSNQTQIEVRLVGRIYSQKKNPLSENFKKQTWKYFYSEAQNLNFSNSVQAAKTVNNWVAKQTKNHIQDLVSADSFSEMTRLVMVNAIYFKGNWIHQFNPVYTKDADFHVSKRETIKVKTMYQTGSFHYAENWALDAQILELPYKNHDYTLVIYLPRQMDGVLRLVKKLQSTDTFFKSLETVQHQLVEIHLPSIEIISSIDLGKILPAMGVNKIFDGHDPQLVGLFENKDEKMPVTNAVQKAYIKINEVGSEAAAASAAIEVISGLAPQQEVKQFKADRPFAYYLNFRGENILFCGVYRGNSTK